MVQEQAALIGGANDHDSIYSQINEYFLEMIQYMINWNSIEGLDITIILTILLCLFS